MMGYLARSASVLLLACMLLTASTGSADRAASFVKAEDPLDSEFRYQPLPGELDYEDLSKASVWSAGNTNVSTAILVEDLDEDGLRELVFGTDTGRLVVLELGSYETLLDVRPVKVGIQDLAVGDVDGEGGEDLVFSTSTGLHCWDFEKGRLIWEERTNITDSEVHLVDMDGAKGMDVVLLWSEGDVNYLPTHHVAGFTGNGVRSWRTDLVPAAGGTGGPWCSALVADLDGDGSPEIFVNDLGFVLYEFSQPSRDLWVLNATTGAIEKGLSVARVHFASHPNLVVIDGKPEVSIGLSAISTGAGNDADVLLYDGRSGTVDMLDVPGEPPSWSYVTFVPGQPSGWLFLSSSDWRMLMFSLEDPGVNWSRPRGGGRHSADPITCDIDDDGEMEILAPGGGVHIIDALSGEFEAQITQEHGRALNIRLTLADLDDDGRSEVVFGYFDDFETSTYEVFLMGDVDIDMDRTILGGIYGWGIIIFVVGANLVLIALLVRDWRRPRPEGE